MKLAFHFLLSFFLLSVPLAASTPLSLERVWELVMENHEQVKALCLEDYQAKLTTSSTLRQLLPKIGASASLTYANPTKEVDGSRIVPTSFRAGSLQVNQALFDLRFRSSYLSAKYASEATHHQTEFRLHEILYLASESFLGLLQTQQLLEVVQHQLDLATEQGKVSKERYEAGEVSVTDMLQSEEQVNRALRALHDLEHEVRIYEELLTNFIGVDATSFEIATPQYESYATDDSLDYLLSVGRESREDLKSIEASIEASKYLVKTLKRTWFPKLDFVGEYTLASPETLSVRNNDWTAALWVTVPIYDGGNLSIDIKKARAEFRKQELLYDRALKEMRLEITTAFQELTSAKENYSLLEQELTLSQENYEILSDRYKRGQTTHIDLMDALSRYIQAQADHTNAYYNLILLSLKVKKASGFFDSSENLRIDACVPVLCS